MSRLTANSRDSSGKRKSLRRKSREVLREAAAGLRPFGYRPVDAEFLAAATLLGGYFLRRQYRSFAGCRPGSAEVSLLRRATRNGHATAVVGKTLYRLRGAALYKALGSARSGPWVRARRAVKQRLLALDYFVERGDEGIWLLTEKDKAAHFAALGIPADRFPASARKRAGKPRAFPDGFPIKLKGGHPPTVALSYAHAGASEGGMARHIRRHEALAGSLADLQFACEWVVLADSPLQFRRLRRAWRRWRARSERDWAEGEYFELRQAVEKRRWDALSRESVERYAHLLALHRTDGTERRYAAWLENGAPGRGHETCLASSCGYREVLLDHDYAAADAVARRH